MNSDNQTEELLLDEEMPATEFQDMATDELAETTTMQTTFTSESFDVEPVKAAVVAAEPADTRVINPDKNQKTFADLNISEDLLKAVTDMGFVTPSPIQAEGIPPILAGRDVIGQAQTGTGKTAAFGIPALELIDISDRSVQVLVLCPTRELALQVADEIKKLAKYKRGLRVEAIYGGDSIERQIRSLKTGVHIVIGTPGRVMDHMDRNTLKLENVKMMILDEADEMLDMGFREDIESILEDMPQERQTILFSATMSKPIMNITQRFQKNPVLVKVVKKELTNDNIEQVYFEVKPKAKVEVMARLIDLYDLKLMLVFCNTKRKVDEIVEDLLLRGYQAEGLHGDLRQQQRNNVMSKFRSGVTSILVATDVAARGIDVDDVDAVINFDVPLDQEYYVHRIGRTGRAGKKGRAFTFVARDERYRFRDIQTYTKSKVEKGNIPTFADIVGIRKTRFIEQLAESITESKDLNLYNDVLPTLLEQGFTAEQIVAALAMKSMGVAKNEFSDQNLGLDDAGERKGRFDRADSSDRRGGGYEDRRSGERGASRFGGGDRERSPRESGSRFSNSRDERPRFGGDRDERPRFGGDRERKPYFDRDDSRAPRERDAAMTRLMVSIGRKDYVRPGDIVGAIAGEAGIPGSSIGHIDIFDKHTFVDVPNQDVNRVLDAMEGNTIKGRRISVEVSK